MSSAPVLAHTREELATLLAAARARGEQVGLVPTMGALHEGHASLVRAARERVTDDGRMGPVVVSVFVNPLQFGANEDLDRYPRTLEADLEVCAREGADIVFAPSVDEVYPGGPPQVTVRPGPLGKILEGKVRPGHFRGVLTVVAKLFGLVRPDVAVFGQKDYQQLALIRRMVLDLALGVEIVAAETVREDDGLALSSRNRYLEPEQREQAVALSRALLAAQENAGYGAEVALDEARAELRAAPGVDLDYLVITDPDLDELPAVVPPGTPARILVAARVGGTRLIDNLPLMLGTRGPAGEASPPNRERSEPGSAEQNKSPGEARTTPSGTSEASE
ncbi:MULTISPECIES: pantoate--beta-alanine ligase [unclassified Nocardioides]|uniref:Pantothenate synthetase n=1 Tax=Nocardioides sp. (strain ATCC BAA-499 / JS614) TaxID=196162 RepID=PANC_NOCSJ|nr:MULTISPECIES: pantoate--beta-alanine ligase [unclassified Nocardioides]A1SDW7.1 RecName: Full=Pantothenate synthetase; Short=PS; AltName: Full=Pantoate--beta-alanine ligase; AltName: Full=Pantoate-activating enzyme [Nocardioides sp. JS614]ABL80002.1 pantothenate synthetase [Nocardioides sp. JS614]